MIALDPMLDPRVRKLQAYETRQEIEKIVRERKAAGLSTDPRDDYRLRELVGYLKALGESYRG